MQACPFVEFNDPEGCEELRMFGKAVDQTPVGPYIHKAGFF